jgi:hypothetical protein
LPMKTVIEDTAIVDKIKSLLNVQRAISINSNLGIKSADPIRRLCSGNPDPEEATVDKQFRNEI